MDKQRRKFLYNRCNPGLPLEPGDDLYIDLDARGVRGLDWVERLAAPIELAAGPTMQLFTGLPGSGKSTELRRLVKRLAGPDSNFEVVYVDAREWIDLDATLDVPDLLLTLVGACERAVVGREQNLEGEALEAALEGGFLRRVWDWLTHIDFVFKDMEFSVEKVAKLPIEIQTRPPLRHRIRETIGAHLSRFLGDVRSELARLDERAIALGCSGLIVVLDSLEQLRGTATTWPDVLASAEQVFGAKEQLGLPIHVIYTVPPSLITRMRFEQLEFLPMIKLRTKTGERHQAGYDAALELILQRIPERDLAELFGADTEQRIERLIDWSGGYPRELVRLIRDALREGSVPLSDVEFRRMLNLASGGYHMLVTEDSFAWLARVAVYRTMSIQNEAQRQIADTLIRGNVIMRYLNEEYWFDVHPSICTIPGAAREIERLRSTAP